jgi:hypothetical protein
VDGQAAGDDEYRDLSGGIPVSFGQDSSGEIYLIDRDQGLFRVTAGR